MNISDFGATSRSDVATVLLGVPAAYFGWVLFGDTSLVDPQYAAPLIGAAVLGLKKTVELSLPWRRVRQGRALARVRGTLAALPGSVGGKPPLAELLDDMERVSLGERRRLPVENLVDTTRRELHALYPRWQETPVAVKDLDRALMDWSHSSSSDRETLAHHVRIVRGLLPRDPDVTMRAELERLVRVGPLLDADKILAERDEIVARRLSSEVGSGEQAQAALDPSGLKQLADDLDELP